MQGLLANAVRIDFESLRGWYSANLPEGDRHDLSRLSCLDLVILLKILAWLVSTIHRLYR